MVAQTKGVFALKSHAYSLETLLGCTLHCVNRVKETKSRTLTCPEG